MSIYNKEKPEYFLECLKSIKGQSLQPTEVVIVEDGPLSDEIYAVLEDWQAELNIIRVPLLQNVGLGNALMHGLKACSYNLIARMDTDDLCHPERFEKQINIMKDSSLDVCGSWISEFDVDPSKIESVRKLPEFHSNIKQYAKNKNPLNHPSVMFRLDKVLSVGGYENVKFFEDYFLWLKLLANKATFYNIQEPLVNMRAGMSQLSRRGGINYAKYEYNFLYTSWKSGYFSFFQLLQNCIFRLPLRVLPQSMLKKIYLFNRKYL